MPEAAALTTGEAAFISRHWVTLPNGQSYHYVASGAPNLPVLVFLHGYTDSWRSVEPILADLAAQHLVLALDQRGHGDTGHKFDSYGIADFAADAIDFIETLGLSDVILVGHSLGSLVAQRVAADRPDLVGKLVLIGASDTASNVPGLRELQSEVAALPDPVPADFAQAFQAGTVHQQIDEALLSGFVRESQRVPLKVWQSVIQSLIEDKIVVADRITVPTLILWGDRDGIFDLQAQQRLERAIANARLIAYHDIGHAPHWERPGTVSADIATFSRSDR